MTRSETFTAAHALARQHHVAGESYAVTFGAALRCILSAPATLPTLDEELATTAQPSSIARNLRAQIGRRDELLKAWTKIQAELAAGAPSHPARRVLEGAIAWGSSPASDSYWRQRKCGAASTLLADLRAGRPHNLPF